ncbi:MAG: type IV pilus modification PilV family protein [Opitutaceae bacterium]
MNFHTASNQAKHGFSLVEVVMAIGIFLVTVLALVGLLGPTLKSVDQVEKTDEISSIVNSLNVFLQSSPKIQPTGSRFDAVYTAVNSSDYATVFVYRKYTSNTSTDVELVIGFDPGEGSIDSEAHVNSDFANAAGPIYRAVLTASSVLPTDTRSKSGDVYTLSKGLDQYNEGYLAMEVRIYAEDSPGPNGQFSVVVGLDELSELEPVFTYNMAIVR